MRGCGVHCGAALEAAANGASLSSDQSACCVLATRTRLPSLRRAQGRCTPPPPPGATRDTLMDDFTY